MKIMLNFSWLANKEGGCVGLCFNSFMNASKQMGRNWQQKAKEFFFNHAGGAPTPKGTFHLLTITLLSLLLPLSFFLLVTVSGTKHYLQTLTLFLHSPQQQQPLQIDPCILYFLFSISSIAINCLMGKITLLNDSSTTPVLQPRLYIALILLWVFQFCVGSGIEESITAGVYDFNTDDSFYSGKIAAKRSLLSRVFFLLGLQKTTQVWYRMVVDDTVLGGAKKNRWIEMVVVAASSGTLWWWRMREEVESLVVMVEARTEQFMDVGMVDFIGWWLYYLIVTIGMVRIVKGLMWMFMVALCRRRITGVSVSPVVESSLKDDKV